MSGARARHAGLVAAALLAAAPAPAATGGWSAHWPRFTLFGWVSPPVESTTVARYGEMAAAGMNLTVLAQDEPGLHRANLARLDASRPWGIRNLLLDLQLAAIDPDDPATLAIADTVVARYRGDPAFMGYYLGDEPAAPEFPTLAWEFDWFRERDPSHPGWNNLHGRGSFASADAFAAYLRDYVARVRPAVLCTDHYDFHVAGDLHLLVENVATEALVARESGLPFWGIVQLVEHLDLRAMTPGLLRWQVAQYLAWGATGIGYFTYWTPAPDSAYGWHPAMIDWASGARTPLYDLVRDLNRDAAPIGCVLAGARWLRTGYAGSVPPGGAAFSPDGLLLAVDGRATVAEFADSTATPLVFVANADSEGARTVSLRPAGARAVARLAGGGSSWESLAADASGSVGLALGPGEFVLLRLAGVVDSLAARAPRALRVAPNPARGAVRFSRLGAAGAARLRVLDVAGRCIWSHALADGEREVAWDGRRDDGGRARPGAYHAVVTDGSGTVTSKALTWLGAP